MRKKIVCILLTLCILGPTLNYAFAEESGTAGTVPTYSDVSPGDWFYTYVSDLSKKGIVSGYPDGTFKPDGTVTCGEVLKLIVLAAGYREQAPTDKHWASGYLRFAAAKKFVDMATVTDLDAPMSRLQIGQIAAKSLGLYKSEMKSPFYDTSDGYVVALYNKGIIQGSYDGNNVLRYYPSNRISRAEASTIIWRIKNYNGGMGSGTEGNTGGEGSGIDTVSGGKIIYGSYTLDILKDVPVNSYNTSCFAMLNGMMRYSSATLKAYNGIDVSTYQGVIDWNKVKAAGIDFAIIRVGYRGYETGSVNLDDCFERNMSGALAAGIKVGVYFFSQAITAAEATEEANFVLAHIGRYKITYPVVFDWEPLSADTARTNGLCTDDLCKCAAAFSSTVRNAGYKPMIYFNKYCGYFRYNLSKILGNDFWLAQYYDRPTFYYNFQMWQYTSIGKVNGIEGNVDMDICFKAY